MNSAPTLPRSNLKPPPLPKGRALAVVPPADIEDIEDDQDVTAVAEAPPEVLKAARSDIRELRAPRPPAPRPSSVPRPKEPVVKAIHPTPPPPRAVALVPAPQPAPQAAPQPAPKPVPEATPELESIALIRPRPVVFARTAWFFGVYVTTAAFRWTVESLSRGRAWLAAEWRHAAIRANAPRQEPPAPR